MYEISGGGNLNMPLLAQHIETSKQMHISVCSFRCDRGMSTKREYEGRRPETLRSYRFLKKRSTSLYLPLSHNKLARDFGKQTFMF